MLNDSEVYVNKLLEYYEPYTNYMKVGIVGSRRYQNKLKVKNFIYELKKRFNDNLIIVSGGQKEGADGFAKKYSLELNVKSYRSILSLPMLKPMAVTT